MEDVVVIGAGLSGLTAAGQLHQAGFSVLVVDKSRGLGGRLATRRLGATAIDHGCRYLEPFADSALSPIPELLTAGVLELWHPEAFSLSADGALQPIAPGTLYVAPQGMSAVAKALAPGLNIQRHWRATSLTPLPQGWRITGEFLGGEAPQPTALEARAVVVATPAPQAIALITAAAQHHEDLSALEQQLQTVNFEPVMTVMAGYSPSRSPRLKGQKAAGGWLVAGDGHPTLRWIGLDSSKRTDPKEAPKEAVVVIHSSAALAAQTIDRPDLEAVGQELLATAAATLGAELSDPAWMQVHRWRYGFAQTYLNSPVLSSLALPTLVGCGDWCNGGNAEGAIASGCQAAQIIAAALT
ncbi:MAG: FAD-dependent oxidoreductase [Leptolyngbya sp. DLM2.Bin27]|nr:MAG: FAD-dependent oxidoreductase [Leptolyngbya sp. DLM2.Bin27]